MPIIKCKMCGGDIELAADKTFGTCEYCGSTMTLPRVSDDQRAAAFNRGNHFRRMGEFDKALGVYERIVAEDDSDAEAHWCCALSRFGIEYVEDPATYEWLPTCHRASFDSFLEDVDYLAAVEHSDGITRRQYQKDAAKIAEVQRGILATSQNTEPYDVFISYKELDENGERIRDSILAQEIYYRLTEKGWRVFFSRITLEDVPGTQYEPYIFAALNSAKVMIVVGTSAENLNAVWVKNEWSRFLSMMRKDRSKLLIPCYRDMDPYDLPEQLAVLMSYDMGKIGFIQDLIRGVDKVLSAEKKEHETVKETVKETVVVQQGGGPNVTALLKRGQQALEDGEWDKAKEFYDQVLNMDAENAEAFFGLFLAGENCANEDAYIKRACAQQSRTEQLSIAPEADRIEAAVENNNVPGYLEENEIRKLFDFDLSYSSAVSGQEMVSKQEKARFESNRYLNRAFQYAKEAVAERLNGFKSSLYARLDEKEEQSRTKADAARRARDEAYEMHLSKAEVRVAELHRQAKKKAEEEKEAAYQEILRRLEQAKDRFDYDAVRIKAQKLGSYKDCEEIVKQCKDNFARLKKAAAEKKIKQKRHNLIIGVIAALAIAAILVVTEVIIPNKRQEQQYERAEQLEQEGNLYAAAIAFGVLDNYRDSWEKSFSLWGKINQRNTISAGYGHTAAIKVDGTVVAVGDNRNGELGVDDWTDVASVHADLTYTAALRTDGSVYVTKYTGNVMEFGQENVTQWSNVVAITGNDHIIVGLKSNGTLIAAGRDGGKIINQQINESWTNIKSIALGDHLVALKNDGTVIAAGYNEYGQCDVSDWNDIVTIACGTWHTIGLKSDGTVVATGYNENGECNVEKWKNVTAIAAGSFHTLGLQADGRVVATGLNGSNECDVSAWQNIVEICGGDNHTVGLKSDGTVVATGHNPDRRCNVSDWKNIELPTS